MRGWVWWSFSCVLGFAACGEGSSDDGDSASGGASGSAGTTAGASGSSRGGATATGGGAGGSAGNGDQGGNSGASGSDAGSGGDAGGGGGPSCMLAGGVTCSFDEACEVLGCGRAWSMYDETMCVRDNCADTGTCATGERCVAAPVGGRFDDICGNQADSCDPSGDACECLYYEECFPSAVCLSEEEFAEDDECPLSNLGCTELAEAAETLNAYLEGEGFLEPYTPPADLAVSLQTCASAVAARIAADCNQ